MPLVYPLQRLDLAINVWIDRMQNLAKPCKLFIRCNLTDFALSRCPVLHIAAILRIPPLFQGFPSLLEEERQTCQQAATAENAPLN
jgi:hypothetical protein